MLQLEPTKWLIRSVLNVGKLRLRDIPVLMPPQKIKSACSFGIEQDTYQRGEDVMVVLSHHPHGQSLQGEGHL